MQEKIQKAIDKNGIKKALSEPIWMNEEKQIPIKKVRCFVPTVTNPIHLKPHRDESKHPYKRSYHVANDGNYLMAIYESKDNKGNIKRAFEIVNNLKAGEYFKSSVQETIKAQNMPTLQGLIPNSKTIKNTEIPLKYILKTGTLLILWEKSPDEVWDLDLVDLTKRFYKVVGLSIQSIQNKYNYGITTMRHHQEASATTNLKIQDGLFSENELYIAQRKLNHNQLNALVEGYDFKINILGQIEKIDKC